MGTLHFLPTNDEKLAKLKDGISAKIAAALAGNGYEPWVRERIQEDLEDIYDLICTNIPVTVSIPGDLTATQIEAVKDALNHVYSTYQQHVRDLILKYARQRVERRKREFYGSGGLGSPSGRSEERETGLTIVPSVSPAAEGVAHALHCNKCGILTGYSKRADDGVNVLCVSCGQDELATNNAAGAHTAPPEDRT